MGDIIPRTGSVAIGTWPTPDMPEIRGLTRKEIQLLGELGQVFEKHGLKGRVVRVEFDCGTPPQGPPRPDRCVRVTYAGPADRPYVTVFCF